MKKLIPNFYAKNIYSLELDFFKNNGIKYVFCDLDNTLDAFNTYFPSERSLAFIKSLKDNGITPFIVSNNRDSRVGKYARSLDVSYLCRSGKPRGKKIKKFALDNNLNNLRNKLIISRYISNAQSTALS